MPRRDAACRLLSLNASLPLLWFLSHAPRMASSVVSHPLVEATLAPLMQQLSASPRYRLARRIYARNEHYVPGLLFLGGVGWDAATLRRIDALLDNVILGVYLILLGGFIVLLALDRSDRPLPPALRDVSTWSVGAIQFLCGGLFSAYVIYFTQSASLTSASLFLGLLVAVLVANEFVWNRTLHLYGLLGVYTLAVLCYVTFLLPIAWGRMGGDVFGVGVAVSALLMGGLLALFVRLDVVSGRRALGGASGVVAGILLLVSFFYAMHWIPPVPLALRHAGVYPDVAVQGDAYALRYAPPPGYAFWEDPDHETLRRAPGDRVYCFTAIFAPTALETDVYHRWLFYDAADDAWVETDRIGYRVVGGRANGYRGFTFKQNIRPGPWRVVVETEAGRPIGYVDVTVVAADSTDRSSLRTRLYR